MTSFIVILGVLAVVLHLYRQSWTHRDLPQIYTGTFDGELMRVGETYIARRPGKAGSELSIICFPGFLEDMRYFQALYQDHPAELILVNNANYHQPFAALRANTLHWPVNPYPLGTIEYDGFHLGLVVSELAAGQQVMLHGHSRGGAVVLEAGRQYPEVMLSAARKISAILEAPVLPRARVVGRGSKPITNHIARYLLPIVLGLSRNNGPEKMARQPMMRPTSELKEALLPSLYSTARNYSTCVANLRSIYEWQQDTEFKIYTYYRQITVVIGARDDVLDNTSMRASAEEGAEINPGVTILQTDNTNHFVSLEQPHYLLELSR
ncbi:MAG: alpha/beta hydrolase [Pseudomonadota bacterium]